MSMAENLQLWGQEAAHPVPPSRTAAEKKELRKQELQIRLGQLVTQSRAAIAAGKDELEEKMGKEMDRIQEELAALK